MGPCYVMSSEAVTAILGVTSEVNYIPMEDSLFTGVLRERAGVEIIGGLAHIRADPWVCF